MFGPVQEYVAPAIVVAVRLRLFPSHMGELLPAVGAVGIAFTTTVVVPAADVQLLTVAVTLYTPEAAVVAAPMVGFCVDELKLFGPVHA